MNGVKPSIPSALATLALVACSPSGETCAQQVTRPCRIDPPEEPMACTMQYDPVCGCDGKTYGNACAARGAGVSDYSPGACEE